MLLDLSDVEDMAFMLRCFDSAVTLCCSFIHA